MRSVFRLHMRASIQIAALATMMAAGAVSLGAHAAGASADETPYLSENETAMTKMMDDMSVKPTGDVDRDFVAMMTPHHQGAIDMAKAELRYGHNEQLRRIAQQIVIEQQQEIVAMRLALGQPVTAPADSMSPATTHMNMPKEPR